MSSHEKNWVDLCAVEDIPLQGSRIVKSPAGCLALFRTTSDEVFALDDKCPHKGGPLSQGIVHDKFVTCPLHSWVISLETGEAQGADQGRVPTTPVRTQNGRIEIQLSLDAEEQAA